VNGFAAIAGDGCLRLVGELDVAGVPALRARLRQLGRKDLVLDCSGLTFIDCAGLGALVGEHRRRARADSQLTLVAPSGCLTRLLELTGVDGLFPAQTASSES
jgi:stage II sporulation protein AA (anti-sigma F factor antagonist)